MLASCTDFDMCRHFVLQFCELVVSVDKVYFEAAIPENGKDLFYTIYDVLGSSFVRSTECFLLACADAIKSLSCVEFNLGGLHEKVWCALYIHKIDIKVVRWMSLEYDWWKGDTFDRCTCIYRFVNGFSFE